MRNLSYHGNAVADRGHGGDSCTSLFVFCNKRRDKFKILQWDHAGFWLFTVRRR
ncbi:IS66 family insertion sequence element accessory protein TnpB [Paenibacillus marchantiophytorum]|uniref:IS66 family insertion sequence element accessory protein TnpB n=1 Tax=Paenibacillus marchantiophytorum TaxID=1619310 RepID=UPI003570F83E